METENMLGDLLQIIERADKRRDGDSHVQVTVELPMTIDEYFRWEKLTS